MRDVVSSGLVSRVVALASFVRDNRAYFRFLIERELRRTKNRRLERGGQNLLCGLLEAILVELANWMHTEKQWSELTEDGQRPERAPDS